ncbi:Transcriptional regulator kdgR [Raoultella terrigena]|uniref:Transcriptional regulator kdgR n=1 Tax=Raoultella terrigena TaxID=577 RepID=A0A485C628_RAOTE|nr:Transcriptional regulator kdgR [Raoultella terrigena]
MKSLGYVAQEGESEKYSLTLKLFELGARALQNVDLVRSADIQMRELSRLTKETIHLGALDEDSIVYIHKIDSMYNLRMYSRIGRRNPLYSTAIGKVLLAWRDRAEVEQILEDVEYKRSTDRTITAPKSCWGFWTAFVSRAMAKTTKSRKRGYAALVYRSSTALA